MLLMVVPLVTLACFHLIGAIPARLLAGRTESSHAPLIGLSILMIVWTSVGYLGIPVGRAWILAPVLAGVSLLVLVIRKIPVLPGLEVFPFVTGCLAHVWPLFQEKSPASVILDSGDLKTYLGLGNWLQANAVNRIVSMDQAWNTLHAEVLLYQNGQYRIGVPHLFAGILAGFQQNAIDLFLVVSAIFVGMQCMTAYLLALAILRNRKPAALAASLLYSVHPLLQWSGYASFMPQLVGLALGMWLLSIVFRDENAPSAARRGLLLGLAGTALLCAYNELIPIFGLVVVVYWCIRLSGRRESPAALAKSVGFALPVPIVLYLPGLIPAVRGLLRQMAGNTYGGFQTIRPETVAGSIFGLIVPPLAASSAGSFMHIAVIMTLTVLMLTGAAVLLKRSSCLTPWAVILSVGAVLYVFILLRYAYATERTWNHFKLLNYFAPLLFVPTVGAFLSACFGYLQTSDKTRKGAVLCMLGFGLLSVQVAMQMQADGQLVRRLAQAPRIRSDSELAAMAQAHPDERILLDRSMDEIDMIIAASSLRDRAVVWQMDELGRSMELEDEDAFFGKPFDCRIIRLPGNGRAYRIEHLSGDAAFPMFQGGSRLRHIVVQDGDEPADLVQLTFSAYASASLQLHSKEVSADVDLVPPYAMIELDKRKGSRLEVYSVETPAATDLADCTLLDSERADTGGMAARTLEVLDLSDFQMACYSGRPDLLTASEQAWEIRLSSSGMVDGGLVLTRRLEAGSYVLHFDVASQSMTGSSSSLTSGLFVARINRTESIGNLTPDTKVVDYPIVVDETAEVSVLIGLGGWGEADGQLTMRNVELRKMERYGNVRAIALEPTAFRLETYDGAVPEGMTPFRIEQPVPTDSFWTVPLRLEKGLYRVKARASGMIDESDDGAGAKVVLIGDRVLMKWADDQMGDTQLAVFEMKESGLAVLGFGLGGWGRASGAVRFDDLQLQKLE